MNTFNLFGDIVQDASQRIFESDVTPALFVGWIGKQTGDIEINLNSLGGSCMGGLTIANAIKAYDKGKVTANVLGIAASMASVVACACDEVRMGQGSFVMIHNPLSVAMGDAEDLRKEAETLDKVKASIMSFYMSKFSKSAEEVGALMDAETWISDAECETFGFAATPYTEPLQMAAKCDTRLMFAHTPEAAKAYFGAISAPAARGEKADGEAGAEPAATQEPEQTAATQEPEAPAAEPTAQEPAATQEPAAAQAVDWEARYKGASRKIEEMRAAHQKALADAETAHAAKVKEFQDQLVAVRGDLEKAKADLSSATARAETAEKDLADKGEQLDRLTKAHALLTGGVLSPGEGSAYEAQMAAAKTAQEREKLRALKKAGKIK